jgi:transposase
MQIMCHRYPAEQRERATRMALERVEEYGSAWAVAQALGPKLGIGPETMRKWVLPAQTDSGPRSGPTSEELAEIKRLKKENAELREANDILKAASIFFARELCATRRRVDRGGVRDLSRWAVAAAR